MIEDFSKYRIVLASNSPRRRELLAGLGVEFSTRVIDGIDESWPEGLKGQDIPLHISQNKSKAYISTLAPDELVITADTVVMADDRVLGKPHSPAQAREMLHILSGRSHEVITGVTLATRERSRSFAVTTKVCFDSMTDNEIDWYIEHYSPFDKAGAYGIQEWIGYIGVTSIEGSYFNVVGLPVQRLYREMIDFCR
ncbi:MAG: Maf-like protein [Bacteroidaceae bacterium]|nr:Maf-like protein [Bacteroidaceae bacterium]